MAGKLLHPGKGAQTPQTHSCVPWFCHAGDAEFPMGVWERKSPPKHPLWGALCTPMSLSPRIRVMECRTGGFQPPGLAKHPKMWVWN